MQANLAVMVRSMFKHFVAQLPSLEGEEPTTDSLSHQHAALLILDRLTGLQGKLNEEGAWHSTRPGCPARQQQLQWQRGRIQSCSVSQRARRRKWGAGKGEEEGQLRANTRRVCGAAARAAGKQNPEPSVPAVAACRARRQTHENAAEVQVRSCRWQRQHRLWRQTPGPAACVRAHNKRACTSVVAAPATASSRPLCACSQRISMAAEAVLTQRPVDAEGNVSVRHHTL